MIKAKIKKWRYAFILTLVTIISGVFCARLIQWQIRDNDFYEDIALTSTEYTIETDAIRGEIFDANGQPLAQNTTGYRIVINKIFTPEEKLNDYIVKLIELTEKCACKWEDKLPIKRDKNGKYYFEDDRESDIEELKSRDFLNMNPYSTADECMQRLVEKSFH